VYEQHRAPVVVEHVDVMTTAVTTAATVQALDRAGRALQEGAARGEAAARLHELALDLGSQLSRALHELRDSCTAVEQLELQVRHGYIMKWHDMTE
jgi:hypothetical protein